MTDNSYVIYNGEFYHHGIKGQRWGIRRYQNKDGSLTPEGRRRLKLDQYDDEHNSDFTIKKGTKASRVVSTSRYDEYADPQFGGSKEAAKNYADRIIDRDKKLETKYVSIDGVRNSGRDNGTEYYLSWFSEGGYNPNGAHLTMYELKRDIRVASGKQVMDAIIDEVGSKEIKKLLKNPYSTAKSLALNYTKNKAFFDKINKRFADKGYDAVEDINDMDTDMPLIILNSSKTLGEPIRIQNGKKHIDEILKRKGHTIIE